MQPEIAICNIFNQDAERLARFAADHGFSAIDWSIDPSLPEERFLSLIKSLAGFEVRYHCRFHGVDLAFVGRRGDESLSLLRRTVDQVSRAGGRHMTVHIGLGNPTGEGIDQTRAVDNLGTLVEHGRSRGVDVAIENMITPITNDPLVFRNLVLQSDACVTIDIGHAHAVGKLLQKENIFENYILPHKDRIRNAHIYYTELEGFGHVPPDCLSEIHLPLNLLGTAESCDWWVIELMKPPEVLHTRDLLRNYLESRSRQFVETLPENSLSLVGT